MGGCRAHNSPIGKLHYERADYSVVVKNRSPRGNDTGPASQGCRISNCKVLPTLVGDLRYTFGTMNAQIER
jgi:hypothetical protein